MKRQGHLIEKIAAIENLQLAYHKAKKGKAGKTEVFEYEKRLQENLKKLQIKAYVRYMDDLVLWHNKKEILKNVGSSLKQFSE
ncbi:hypothetical protein JW964_26655 [candidate division KSB1 bacterium]|nr:hypothetical protein [candidate division KSB1 bacterium]